MEFELIIEGGWIQTVETRFRADVGVIQGRIAAIGDLRGALAAWRYDASGKILLPGLIDEHVHSRDPGLTHKEDFAHATRAAAAGGITTILEMPNSIPPVLDREHFEARRDALSSRAYVDFGLYGMVLGSKNQSALSGMAEVGAIGFKLFWGYALDQTTLALVYTPEPGRAVVPPPTDGEIYLAFQAIAELGRPVAIHAENAEVIAALAAKERGAQDYGALLRARPPFSELMTIEAALRLAEASQVHLHVLHMAAAEGPALLAQARERGVRVSGETCPHYLFLAAEDYPHIGPAMKILPPIRERRHQEGLWEALQRGWIDTIGSDHAPHTPEDKVGSPLEVPGGAATIQFSLPLLLDAAAQGRLTLGKIVELMAEHPAKIFGLYGTKGVLAPGADADLTLVDLDREWTLGETLSKSPIHPYRGWRVRGAPVAVFLRGRLIMEEGIVFDPPSGHFIRS